MHFGYPFLDKAIAGWSARCIFHPSHEQPLEILWDRQGGLNIEGNDVNNDLWKKMCAALNGDGGIIAQLQTWSKDFGTESNEVLLKHFVCPWDESLVLVANGSPNSSYGYFYLAVNLMHKADAPPEQKTQNEQSREARAKWQANRTAKLAALCRDLRDAWKGEGNSRKITFLRWTKAMAENPRGTLRTAAREYLHERRFNPEAIAAAEKP